MKLGEVVRVGGILDVERSVIWLVVGVPEDIGGLIRKPRLAVGAKCIHL